MTVNFFEIRVGQSYQDVISAQISAGGTQTLMNVDGLVVGKNYVVLESLTLNGFTNIVASQFTASGTSQSLTQPITPNTVPKQFFRIADVP